MAGIKISVVDDVAPFLRGTERMEDALDDVADALDDVADEAQKAGKKAGDDLGTGIERGTDDATKAVGGMEKSFRELARDASKYSKQAGDDLGKNVRRGTDDAEDGLGDFKSEAASTARETAASFDGSADSIAGAFQEVAANALGGFGPLGAAAGLGIAAIGGAFYSSFQENAEKAEERVSSMYQDMAESGDMFLSNQFVQTALLDIFDKAEDAAISWENLGATAEATGLTQETVARAYAGDAEAGKLLTEALNDQLAEQARIADEAAASNKQLGTEYAENNKRVQDAAGLWADQGGSIDDARARTEAYRSAAIAAGIDTVRSVEEARARYGGLGQTISELPSSKTVRLDVDTSAIDRYLNQPRKIVVGFAPRGGVAVN